MSNAVVFKNRIYFAKTTPSVSGTELWATDGIDSTSAFMIKDIESGSGSGYPKCISVVNDFLLVSATTTSTGQELWRCDGTSDGTELIKDLYPGFYGEAFNLRVINGKMIFDSQFANEYKYTSNGTPEGTYPLAFSSVGNNFHPAYGNPVLNGFVYFSGKALADSGNADFELWRTDGTPSGTTRVKDIAPGLGSSIPKYAVGIGNKLYFNAAPDALSNSEPWVTDGTEAGTKKLAEINPGSASSNPMYFTECNGKVFFAAQSTNPVSYNQLWVTDGTPAGTKLVKNFGGYDNIWQLRDLKGTLIFRLGGYLYRSDGTEAGTIKIKPSSQGYVSAGTFPGFGEYDCDGKYYYFRGVDNNIPMIYITDGTDAGTVRLPIDSPPSNIISVGNIRYVNGKIFFNLVFNDGSNYQEWTYCTDGTQTGTKRLFQPSFGRIQGGTIIGNNGKEIFFNTSDYLTPMDHSIVISDGTPQGTKLYSVDDPEELQRAASIVELNGLLYGTIFDQMRGSALYLLERGDVSIRMYSVKQNALKIYPNPSNDIIELDIATDTQVDIYDMTGKKHVSLKYNGSIDIAELAAGSYQVIALSGKEAFTAKLMKTN